MHKMPLDLELMITLDYSLVKAGFDKRADTEMKKIIFIYTNNSWCAIKKVKFILTNLKKLLY